MYKDVVVMERCVVCDSTEAHDTQRELGIETGQVLTFSRNDKGEVLCSRCAYAISQALESYETPQEELDKDREKILKEAEEFTSKVIPFPVSETKTDDRKDD